MVFCTPRSISENLKSPKPGITVEEIIEIVSKKSCSRTCLIRSLLNSTNLLINQESRART